MSGKGQAVSRWRYPPPPVGALIIGAALYAIGWLVADDLTSFLFGAAVSTALVYIWFEQVSRHRRRRKLGKDKP